MSRCSVYSVISLAFELVEDMRDDTPSFRARDEFACTACRIATIKKDTRSYLSSNIDLSMLLCQGNGASL